MNEREILYKVMFVGIREKVGGKEGFEKFWNLNFESEEEKCVIVIFYCLYCVNA